MSILKYWKNSLADADRLDADFEKKKSDGFIISYTEIENGIISSEKMKKISPKYFDDKKKIIEVLLCPAVALVKKEHGSKIRSKLPEAIVPLWISALLDNSGNLKPHPRHIPWISRDYLEPCESDINPLGSIDQMDNYLSRHTIATETWKDFLSFALDMFNGVTGMRIQDFTHDQYQLTDDCFLLPSDRITGVSKNIQDLYGLIEDNHVQSPLLNNFSSLNDYQAHPPLMDADSDKLSVNHYGQMSNEFHLSHSQRHAMHHTALLNSGDLLAINGPPGTGKTTLLQSIVATAVIDKALQKSEPPIIVVSSTNNNAVTNVIESFGKINELTDGNPLAGRWIPNLSSYGAYLKSSFNKDENKNNWLTVTKDNSGGSGFYDQLESQDYITEATAHYLECFYNYAAQEIEDIPAAIDFLHARLEEKVCQMQNIINLYTAFRELEKSMAEKYPSGIDKVIEELRSNLQQATERASEMQALELNWKKYIMDEKWWVPLLLRIPLFKSIAIRRKKLTIEHFCSDNELPDFHHEEEINSWLKDQRTIITAEKNTIENTLKEVVGDLESFLRVKTEWDKLSAMLCMKEDETYLDCLDRTYRYEAFKLAIHYWEGRWLIETESMLSDSSYKRNNGEQGIKLLWRRLAKLTPCFVTTLYMLPSFFSAWMDRKSYPLYEYIDTLIIDEAGQVVPEVAGASFALAKKAIIVGDTQQIQPVWKIPTGVDSGNLQHYRIQNERTSFDSLTNTGILASCGSVMEVARRQTRFSLSRADGGMWLTEHRRCVPEIIGYCNELAYRGKLQPKRESLQEYFLPHMGYAHIPGTAEKSGGSLENKLEAEVIVSWIDRNKEKILEAYSKDGPTRIEDLVAVITPFAPQKRLLLNRLKNAGLKNIKAGTVHTLQGDERPIVIFSPVYDNNYAGKYFFDYSVSMLNVAVSRARDSFLVFGDMGLFSGDTSLPSGLLAKYLFSSEDNEIRNVDLGPYYKTRYGTPVEHIHELEHHREMLRSCIKAANKEVHIISPFLSSAAIKADQLEELLDEASKRGVKVTVYTDEALNYFRKNLKVNYVKAKQILNEHGVQLHLTKRVHSKALWVDSNVLVEGSFNWLSAVRNPKSQWCRYETSLVYRGPKVTDMISRIREDIETKKVIAPNQPVEK